MKQKGSALYVEGTHVVLRLVAHGEQYKRTSGGGSLFERTVKMIDPYPEEKGEARKVQRKLFEHLLKANQHDLRAESGVTGKVGPALCSVDPEEHACAQVALNLDGDA